MRRSIRAACALAVLMLAVSPLAAEPASNRVRRVSDFTSAHTTQSDAPSRLLALGDQVLYVDRDYRDIDLWVSDGRAAGTRLLRQLCGASYCTLQSWVSTGSLAFLRVEESGYGQRERVWRTDGTAAGTFPLTAAMPAGGYWGDYETWALAVAGSFVYFWLCDDYCRLWSSDGTVAGTQRLDDPASAASGNALVVWGDEVYFLGWDTLWRASRRSGRIELVRALPDSTAGPASLVLAGDRLFFVADKGGRELWTSDGTAAGTVPVTAFRPRAAVQGQLTALGGRVWFMADDGGHGWQLWSSDGTPAGTRAATDFRGGAAWGSVECDWGPVLPGSQLAWLGGKVVFAAMGTGADAQLWTTDGNPQSTRQVTGCVGRCPLLDEEGEGYFVVIGDRAAFFGSRACEVGLWISDGTGAGTLELPLAHDDEYYPQAQLAAAGGRWFFTDDYAGGLWTSDGTREGTVRLATPPSDLNLWSALAAVSGAVFFPALDKRGAAGLWQTTGAGAREVFTPAVEPDNYVGSLIGAAGSHVLLGSEGHYWSADAESIVELPRAATGAGLLCDGYADLASVGQRAFVLERSDCDTRGGSAFWSTDGTPEGTMPIALGNTQVYSNVVSCDGGSRALFVSSGGLWTSDGTAAGTALRVPLSGRPWFLRAVDGGVYFALDDPATRTVRLWSSDGTAAGTGPLSPAWWSITSGPQVLGDRLYLLAKETAAAPLALWSLPLEGGAAESLPLAEIGAEDPAALTAAAGRLWFAARVGGDRTSRRWLWTSDGSAGGTRRLPVQVSGGHWLTALGAAVYFSSSDPLHGRELWRSDGTVAGTSRVRDVAPGLADGGPTSDVVEWRGRLYFTADDGSHGSELWSTDGTAKGTRLEADLAPGPAGSRLDGLQVAGDHLFFTADDGTTGKQLWTVAPD